MCRSRQTCSDETVHWCRFLQERIFDTSEWCHQHRLFRHSAACSWECPCDVNIPKRPSFVLVVQKCCKSSQDNETIFMMWTQHGLKVWLCLGVCCLLSSVVMVTNDAGTENYLSRKFFLASFSSFFSWFTFRCSRVVGGGSGVVAAGSCLSVYSTRPARQQTDTVRHQLVNNVQHLAANQTDISPEELRLGPKTELKERECCT